MKNGPFGLHNPKGPCPLFDWYINPHKLAAGGEVDGAVFAGGVGRGEEGAAGEDIAAGRLRDRAEHGLEGRDLAALGSVHAVERGEQAAKGLKRDGIFR